ncbi:bacteriophage antitermination protein Q [Kluyvera ascorbata]|uniref:bacteriophage antitermination protein Q n=1 Tax=Kluyvera ascorbata TaxID=51288 RepID=UPI0035CD0FBE
METRSRRRPMPPINEYAFSSCAWRRAVLRLNASEQAWIKYCYGFDLLFAHQVEICRFIWETYEKGLDGVKIQKRVKLRLMQLVWLAAQDAAAKNSNATYRGYAATALAHLLSVHRDTWYQTYATPWQVLKTITEMLDVHALSKIKKCVPK